MSRRQIDVNSQITHLQPKTRAHKPDYGRHLKLWVLSPINDIPHFKLTYWSDFSVCFVFEIFTSIWRKNLIVTSCRFLGKNHCLGGKHNLYLQG